MSKEKKNGELSIYPVDYNNDGFFGLTKREQFAAMAMQGLCASGVPGTHNQPKNLSVEAVQHADALLAELDKEAIK